MTIEEALRQDVRALRGEVVRLRELLDAPPYVDCICPGCPRKVPQAWASGMCETCAAEDCEHTDGAKATWVECEELKIEVDSLRAEVERLRELLDAPPSFGQAWAAKEAQGYQYGRDALEHVEQGWDMAIAALRARALKGAP